MNANSTRAEAMSAAKLLRVPWHFIRNKLELFRAMRSVADFPSSIQPSVHSLPGELIVSLTSYPKRYLTLPATLKSLLTQSVKPDRVILWIATEDYADLTDEILRLTEFGLEIEKCDDLRSYKKLIPALQRYPNAFVVTADDDVFYERDWLKRLVDIYKVDRPTIVCHRAHKVTFNSDGSIRPYSEWLQDIQTEYSLDDGSVYFPTGVGGVLYYPGSLDKEIFNIEALKRLCPTNDDIWFFWMGQLKGSKYKKARGRFVQVEWPSTQESALMIQNVDGHGNDRQIKAMVEAYGYVWEKKSASKQL